MQPSTEASAEIYFTDFFKVTPEVLEEYGAFNISLINDLPLFIDPFLLFNPNALKVILFCTQEQQAKVSGILRQLGLDKNHDIVLIDGRADNKPSGSKA